DGRMDDVALESLEDLGREEEPVGIPHVLRGPVETHHPDALLDADRALERGPGRGLPGRQRREEQDREDRPWSESRAGHVFPMVACPSHAFGEVPMKLLRIDAVLALSVAWFPCQAPRLVYRVEV